MRRSPSCRWINSHIDFGRDFDDDRQEGLVCRLPVCPRRNSPVRSVVLTAPSSGADLLILQFASNGSSVNAGDVVVQFDSTTQQRTLEQHRSELKQAESEVQKAEAEGRQRIRTAEAELAQLRSAQTGRLDLQGAPELVSPVEAEKLALPLSDAEQHVIQLQQTMKANARAAAADADIARQKRDKAGYDAAETERTIASLTVKAPAAGHVSLMPNFRAGGPMGRSAPEFKRGDRAWFGAPIADLPDLSAVSIGCRVDEADRARVQPGFAQFALASTRFRIASSKAASLRFRMVARPDFTSFPPVRNFDVVVSLTELDPRVKSGMSASARIELVRLPGVVVVPARRFSFATATLWSTSSPAGGRVAA